MAKQREDHHHHHDGHHDDDDDDDFSFPTTTDPPLRFIESPPLWRRPTSKFPAEIANNNNHHHHHHQLDQSRKATNYKYSIQPQRKSFSYIEGRRSVGDNNNFDDDEEEEEEEEEGGGVEDKMDMLWEDFNEEFSAAENKIADTDRRKRRHLFMSTAGGGGRMLNNVAGCVQVEQALKLSKANYNIKRPSIVEFVKVLKKLFFNHNNSHPPLHSKSHQW